MPEYRYLILRQQPSLYSTQRENFAILVEGRQGKMNFVFAVGRTPEPTIPISDIGKTIGEKIPEILDALVRDALKNKDRHQDILDIIHENLTWNFQATKPESLKTNEPIYAVAFKLFAEHVAGADEMVRALEVSSERMLRPAETRQRLGETFQAVVQIPEGAFVPA